jgi:hypothetical protein
LKAVAFDRARSERAHPAAASSCCRRFGWNGRSFLPRFWGDERRSIDRFGFAKTSAVITIFRWQLLASLDTAGQPNVARQKLEKQLDTSAGYRNLMYCRVDARWPRFQNAYPALQSSSVTSNTARPAAVRLDRSNDIAGARALAAQLASRVPDACHTNLSS